MKTFRQLTEAKDTIVFAFGRFNPPTIGHEKLIEAVDKVAGSNDFRIYPSFTKKPDTDPLPHPLKVAYMRNMFKKYARHIKADKKAKTLIMVAEILYKEGYKNLIMVAGSDRIMEFTEILTKYNGVPDKKGNLLYDFESVKVVSAGERDPDAEGVEGMSASKMRAAVTENDFKSFEMGLPRGFRGGRKLFNDVRKHMGIREVRDMGEMDFYEEMRDSYLTGKMWNVGEIIITEHGESEVVHKGTNYLAYMTKEGKVHKSWLHDIAERNYKQEYANYHGRPAQIERRSSRNKARRAMGDKVVKGMDVGHKDNNPLNNDPKNLRNEDPSKNRREPRLREEKVPNDDLNWVETGGSFGKKRRFPTFVVKKEGNKYNAYDEQNKMSLKAGANNLEGLVKMLKPYIEKRTGSWKFEEIDLDETWLDNLTAKISQMTHPKGYEDMVKDYIKLMKQKEYKKHPSLAGSLVAREYQVPLKGFNSYINKLVDKGKLPKELKAEYVPEMSFKDLVQQIQERELTDTEQKRREEIAKGMSDKDFKKKYGDRWKEVKMAVATNMAKKESLKT